MYRIKKQKLLTLLLSLAVLAVSVVSAAPAYAACSSDSSVGCAKGAAPSPGCTQDQCDAGGGASNVVINTKSKHACGSNKDIVYISLNIGCQGEACVNSHGGWCATDHNAITDAVFAIIRFLSNGVGIVLVLGLIVGGIQLSAAQGDPGARAKAIGRLTSVLVALLIYVFAYALLNFVIPKGFFQ